LCKLNTLVCTCSELNGELNTLVCRCGELNTLVPRCGELNTLVCRCGELNILGMTQFATLDPEAIQARQDVI
jgi:hypothetical protein